MPSALVPMPLPASRARSRWRRSSRAFPALILQPLERLELFLREVCLAESLIRLSELIVDIGIFRCKADGDFELSGRAFRIAARQQDLAVQVSRVRIIRPRAEDGAQLRQRLVLMSIEIEHGRERIARLDVFAV